MPESSDDRFIMRREDIVLRYDLMTRAAVEGLAQGGDADAQAWLDQNPPA